MQEHQFRLLWAARSTPQHFLHIWNTSQDILQMFIMSVLFGVLYSGIQTGLKSGRWALYSEQQSQKLLAPLQSRAKGRAYRLLLLILLFFNSESAFLKELFWSQRSERVSISLLRTSSLRPGPQHVSCQKKLGLLQLRRPLQPSLTNGQIHNPGGCILKHRGHVQCFPLRLERWQTTVAQESDSFRAVVVDNLLVLLDWFSSDHNFSDCVWICNIMECAVRIP